jgi:hypothetical protein
MHRNVDQHMKTNIVRYNLIRSSYETYGLDTGTKEDQNTIMKNKK